jgi:hypothetical protein
MTYREAIASGYKPVDQTYQRGYISRKIDPNNQVVMVAGGNRKGDKYILLPCWHSTQYCIRQYITR